MIAKLDKNEKLVLAVDSSLDYQTKDGELKQKQAKTAAINVILEAARTKDLGVDKITAGFKMRDEESGDSKWQNYFINKASNGNIVLTPMDEDKKDQVVCLNKMEKDGKSFYVFDEKQGASTSFVNSLTTNSYTKKDGMEFGTSLVARISVKDEKLENELKAKGKDAYAVISKDGVRVTTNEEEKGRKAASSKENELER